MSKEDKDKKDYSKPSNGRMSVQKDNHSKKKDKTTKEE